MDNKKLSFREKLALSPLPMKWYKFNVYFRLPFGMIFAIYYMSECFALPMPYSLFSLIYLPSIALTVISFCYMLKLKPYAYIFSLVSYGYNMLYRLIFAFVYKNDKDIHTAIIAFVIMLAIDITYYGKRKPFLQSMSRPAVVNPDEPLPYQQSQEKQPCDCPKCVAKRTAQQQSGGDEQKN